MDSAASRRREVATRQIHLDIISFELAMLAVLGFRRRWRHLAAASTLPVVSIGKFRYPPDVPPLRNITGQGVIALGL
jgi:hypothetical protein